MQDNKSTLTGKVKRYASVSSKMTGIAARMAGNKIIGNNDINKNADSILNALGGLKGPLMKVAQLLSTIPDAIPKEYAEKLQTLQSEAPSMGWFFCKKKNGR
jgi:predicted unusual protein kinase regulating ubiquinone biosynthesis (AarF/ABC1/UbiB family)